MSDSTNQEVCIDLIDFHVVSPVISRRLPISDRYIQESENLIDTELPVFEQKLQTASSTKNLSRRTSKDSIDVDDILININSEDFDRDSLDGEQVGSDDLLAVCSHYTDSDTTIPEDNYEALKVLKNLDDLLNATLEESNSSEKSIAIGTNNDTINSEENKIEEENAQQILEHCLEELDNYLKAIDDGDGESLVSSDSYSSDEQSSLKESASTSDLTESRSLSETFGNNQRPCLDFNEGVARERLRQIEENYSKFVSSGIVNRSYEDTENNCNFTPDGHLLRPLSACAGSVQPPSSKHPARAATSLSRRERHRLIHRRQSLNETHNAPTGSTPCRTSGPDVATLPKNWLSRDVTQERRAHASADCCTGTVIVEPLHKQTITASSLVLAVASCEEFHGTTTNDSKTTDLWERPRISSRELQSIEDNGNLVIPSVLLSSEPDANGTSTGSWLRSSMRRLQQLNLPSNEEHEVLSPLGIIGGTGLETIAALRPVSAPSRLPPTLDSTERSSRSRSRVSHEPNGRARSSSASSRSRRPRSISSSISSLVSSVESFPSRMPSVETSQFSTTAQETSVNASNRGTCDRSRTNDMPEADSPLGRWPHSLSSMMACLGCTLGLFNISRFSILTIHFGANFIFQFIVLSLVFGLPLFTLQLCLGQQLGAGVIDMWRISPLFQGVGVSLLITQALMGLYSIIGVSWMFVYFRDAFITTVDKYRWAEPFIYYRKEYQLPQNGTYKITETVPDYLNGVVFHRYHLPSGAAYGTIKFQLAFNLAVVWMIVFVSLSKGLRSYGKVIFVFMLLPVFGTFVLCAKLLGLMPPEFVNMIFPETSWEEFFLNSRSWLAAAQETFLTWGLLGAAIMQIASHNKHKHLLQRDSTLVVVITISVLLLVAFLANTCVQILKSYGYTYYPSSFERMSTYQFLRSVKDPLPPSLASTPVRYMLHNSFILGERVVRPGVENTEESGYQVLRLATELLPATFALLGADQVSPFWAVLTYFIFIMFGISQQLAIWHCVITGIMAIKTKVLKSWETTITFFSCACGYILGLPMATELGIYFVYFMDYTMGSIWWLSIVILLQIVAVFMVRGRPYSGDTVVTALFNQSIHTCFLSWAPALLSFTWNVILPVALMVLCITTFRNGNFRDMFIWHHVPFADYWPLWARQVGSILQLLPILCVPFVAVIQSYRYLNNGPSDILERVQLLYRPPIGEHMEDPPVLEPHSSVANSHPTVNTASEDPPPKYTPPPSYTTATGARLAKFLRQSIRRSMRRIANALGESSTAGASRNRPSVVQHCPLPPPEYNEVFVEMTNTSRGIVRSATTSPARISTLERLRSLQSSPNALTAAEVASILRNSFRRSTLRSPSHIACHTFVDNSTASLSAEHLVNAEAPIGQTSLVMDHLSLSDNENKAQPINSSVI